MGIDQLRLFSHIEGSIISSLVPNFSNSSLKMNEIDIVNSPKCANLKMQEYEERYLSTSPLIGLISELCGYVRPLAPQTLVGVFDGHNGAAASSFLATNLPLILSNYITTSLLKFIKEDLNAPSS